MIETLNNTKDALLEQHHKNCLFNRIMKKSEALSFKLDSDGNLNGTFNCDKRYQGYDNRIHGGVIAAIIDESMVHFLMARGITGFTTELSVKYRHPVFVDRNATIKTTQTDVLLDGLLVVMHSEIIQNKKTAITAEAKFYTST